MTVRSAFVGLLTAPALVLALTVSATAFAPGGTDGDATSPPAPTTVKVTDPRRDAEGSDARERRLSEITRVRYHWVPGSDRLRIATSFARLQRGGSGGALNQHVGILFASAGRCQDSWIVSADNQGRASMRYDDWCDDEHGRARPEVLEVTGRYGAGGVLRVTVSTELFGDQRVALRTVAQVGDGRAWDFTRFTRARRVG